jgi:uncharacterized protein YkwD
MRQAGGGTGHIIVGANGRTIRSEEDLNQVLAVSAPGDVVKFLASSIDGNFYEVIPVTLESSSETSPAVVTPSKHKSPPSSVPEETPWEKLLEEEIFRAVNRARAQKGLVALQGNLQLQQIARRHSEDMASRLFFGHRNPDGQGVVDRVRAGGIADFIATGENILSGKPLTDPGQAVREWLKSSRHRKNVLSPRYTESGVGIAQGENGQVYVTQVFLER